MTAPLTFGLSLPNRAVLFGTPVSDLVGAAVTADRSGLIDSVWVGDNFVSKPRLEAVALLSHLAAHTERVRLGTVCLATFPLRHVVQFAIQWGSLDVLSGGRTVLAVCNGVPASAGAKFENEMRLFGVQSKERPGRVQEGVQLLRRLWSEGPVTHEGRYYAFSDIEVQPKPANPDLPILIAANPWAAGTEKARDSIERRVATFADGWQTDSIPVEEFGASWRRMREHAAEAGREDAVREATLHLMVNVNPDAAAGRREVMDFLDRYYGKGYKSDEQLDAWIVSGPPEQVAEGIQRFVDAGCTTPIVRFASPDQPGQLDRFLGEVMPYFAGVGARA